jgi:hypothetical protein
MIKTPITFDEGSSYSALSLKSATKVQFRDVHRLSFTVRPNTVVHLPSLKVGCVSVHVFTAGCAPIWAIPIYPRVASALCAPILEWAIEGLAKADKADVRTLLEQLKRRLNEVRWWGTSPIILNL